MRFSFTPVGTFDRYKAFFWFFSHSRGLFLWAISRVLSQRVQREFFPSHRALFQRLSRRQVSDLSVISAESIPGRQDWPPVYSLFPGF